MVDPLLQLLDNAIVSAAAPDLKEKQEQQLLQLKVLLIIALWSYSSLSPSLFSLPPSPPSLPPSLFSLSSPPSLLPSPPSQLQVSILRVLHLILPRLALLQLQTSLPSLLATLKVAMTTGLPGHMVPLRKRPLKPHPDVGGCGLSEGTGHKTDPFLLPFVNMGYQAPSVAGPKQSKSRRKVRSDPAPSGHTPTKSQTDTGEKERAQHVSSGSDSELSDTDLSSSSSGGNSKLV